MRDRTGPETATVRNLEQIEEQSGRGPGANRLGAMVMASFGGACIVFCSLALVRSPADERARPADPLGELALASPAGAAKVKSAAELAPDDVSFPNVLSDHKDATTAMAAVRADHARNAALPSDTFGPLELGREPPLATDRLPVVPLPAQDILADHATPVGHADKLQGMAKQLSREQDNGELSSPGVPGGHQLQVSSFRTRAEAEVFTLALRRRGHK
ncbi:MAG: SPOR domain-containing protein, partial [Myxococcales bacterium]|nr:SPOR domain-containing protein [Myxococcales bacterium]